MASVHGFPPSEERPPYSVHFGWPVSIKRRVPHEKGGIDSICIYPGDNGAWVQAQGKTFPLSSYYPSGVCAFHFLEQRHIEEMIRGPFGEVLAPHTEDLAQCVQAYWRGWRNYRA